MFPSMLYTLDNGVSAQVVQDIFRRVTLSDELKSNNAFFDQYDIMEGETPEIVSQKFYRESQYHWIIMIANDIVDPRYDWPLTQPNLVDYCKSKYGSNNIYSTHHYEDAQGYEVNSDHPSATAISNFEYEDKNNESKRRIKILKGEVVSEIVSNFETLINQ